MNASIDMSQFVAAKSDQLNADDLIGGSITIRIRGVRANEGSPEQPVSFFYDGDDGKPFKPCKTMRRLIMAAWGKEAANYVGRSMTLYRDPKVKFGGMAVGGIRISHMSHIDGQMTIALMETKGKRAPHVVKPLATKLQPSDAGHDSAGGAAVSGSQPDTPSADAGQPGAASDEPSPLELQDAIRAATDLPSLQAVWTEPRWVRGRKLWAASIVDAVTKLKDERKQELTPPPADTPAVAEDEIPF